MAGSRRWLFLGGCAAGLGLAVFVMVLDGRVRTYLAGPPIGGIRIYAPPRTLQPGPALPGGSLTRILSRLGYRPSADASAPLAPGEFRVEGNVVEFAQHPSPAPWTGPLHHVRVTLQKSQVREVRDIEAGPLDHLELEPELLAVIGGSGPVLGADAEVAPPAC